MMRRRNADESPPSSAWKSKEDTKKSQKSRGSLPVLLLTACAIPLLWFQLHREETSSSFLRTSSNDQCRYYLAESAIPMGGLGVYTATDVPKGALAQPTPDICIYVADTPSGTAFHSHSWAQDVFNGAFEGHNPRAACEGFATLFNSLPESVKTSRLNPMPIQTNGGLHRQRNPGAGAISQYFGIWSQAVRDIPAGSELTIDYGDWQYDEKKKYKAPKRSVSWLRQNGLCMDNIDIQPATDPEMGRGAFARYSLSKGSLVAPMPLQIYPKRSKFAKRKPEAQFVNYCLSPRPDSELLLFPYGSGVNLINHSNEPNVGLRWSKHHMHHGQWLSLPFPQLMEMQYPGSLLLEVYALREIAEGEEFFLDYGSEWQAAWDAHVEQWKPWNKGNYVYPAEMDPNEPLRTVEEQKTQPYAQNLHTACHTPEWDRDPGPMRWTQPTFDWPEGLVLCEILARKRDPETGEDVYDVVLNFEKNADIGTSLPREQMYIDTRVPRSAISWVDQMYRSDLHLPNGFRHPIMIPPDLVPEAWKEL